MKKGKVLLIDDNKDVLMALDLLLNDHFSQISKLEKPDTLNTLLKTEKYDIIILDMNFRAGLNTGNEGIFWLREILKLDKDAVVILITAYGDIELAVKAIKEGATDFVTKPWDDEKLITTVTNAFKLKKTKQEVDRQKDKQNDLKKNINEKVPGIIGESKKLQEILKTVEKVAKTDANILITGENGTGKELIAREVHKHSNRANELFISVDLSALPETLLESELFGYNKGAFTDAKNDQAGKIEIAADGTLFIDEIGNLSLSAQSKLLTVLQNRVITRLGSTKKIEVNFRLVTATNTKLQDLVEKGEFREDLFYRLNTIVIDLPPLRDRHEDIPLLINHFKQEFEEKYKKDPIEISKEAIQKCKEYHWPGNIRELYHTIEKVVILTEDNVIGEDDFSFEITLMNSNHDTLNLDQNEETLIRKAIDQCNGNLSNAAKLLGVSRKTLYNKIHKYGI